MTVKGIEKGDVSMMALSQANIGTIDTVKWNFSDYCSENLTGTVALRPGTWIEVVSSYFGNMIIRVNGKFLALDKDTADKVKI